MKSAKYYRMQAKRAAECGNYFVADALRTEAIMARRNERVRRSMSRPRLCEDAP